MDDSSACVVQPFESLTLDQLLPRASRDALFSPRERRDLARGRGVERWAARLAAKQAVARIVPLEPDGLDISQVEVLPAPDGRCVDPGRCAQGHPLAAWSRGGQLADVQVSASHRGGVAVAVAARASRTALSIGIDVVDLATVRARVVRSPDAYVRTVLADVERDWVLRDDVGFGMAACLAVKEAVIKTVGVRPRGFDWRDIGVDPGPHRVELSAATRALAAAVEAATGATSSSWTRCELDPSLREEAAYRLTGTRGGQVAAAAAWCVTARHLFAMAMLQPMPDTSGERERKTCHGFSS